MSEIELSLTQARALQLAALGLLTPPTRAARKADVLKTICNLHQLQIDTISVVARSQYLVLWSRLGAFPLAWLDELLEEKKLFEYWSHAACLLPSADYPLHRTNMLNLEDFGAKRAAARLKTERKALNGMLAHVRENGAVRTIDFEREGGAKGNGWWDWKPQKVQLETLFTAGEIMVARREQFHRVYDLRERVLPPQFHAERGVSRDALNLEFSRKAVAALGIVTGRWIGDYFYHAGRVPKPHPERMVDAGEFIRVKIEGFAEPAYVHKSRRALLKQAAAGALTPMHTTLLSPFDPLVCDRERALALFEFDYRIECYTPETKRKYGYFTLPLLHAGKLIGRVDAKAHRREGVFELKSVHLESGVKMTDQMIAAVGDAVTACAHWHGTSEVTVQPHGSEKFAKSLQKYLRATSAQLAKTTDFLS